MSLFVRMSRGAGCALLVVAAAASCSTGEAGGLDPEVVADDARQARQRWDDGGPADYTFRLGSWCGNRALIGRYDVTVTGGRVTEVEQVPGETAFLDGPREYREAGGTTIDGILDRIEERAGEVTEVSYDERLGYPVKVFLDPIPEAIDDEECYEITRVAAVGD
ncbi:DUF6174 domain-containing protein [Myceligenerans crystallogenes]